MVPRRILLALGTAAAGGAALATVVRRRRSSGGEPAEDRTWTCSCGTAYRVTGEGRHQVHRPEGAPEAEPVMDGRCVHCGQGLPGERIAA
jgi:hypothetical protein